MNVWCVFESKHNIQKGISSLILTLQPRFYLSLSPAEDLATSTESHALMKDRQPS
jgi:hypothetical protein